MHNPCLKVTEIHHTMDGLDFYKQKCSLQQNNNARHPFIQQKYSLKLELDEDIAWTLAIERNARE
eukprot:9432950-Ditylum_brightwellii.AAC.1